MQGVTMEEPCKFCRDKIGYMAILGVAHPLNCTMCRNRSEDEVRELVSLEPKHVAQ